MFLHSKLWVKVCLVVVVVGLVAAVYAYSRLSQTTAGPKVSITSLPLEFSMQLNKAEYTYGENITIKFRLENIGNITIKINRCSPPDWPSGYKETSYSKVHDFDSFIGEEHFHFGFRIMDINGTEICELSEGILDYVYSFRMDPGGWIEQTIILDYYSIEWVDVYNHYQLSRGTYQIGGVLRCCSYTLETPSITFIIE
jgi:hypothetical protein